MTDQHHRTLHYVEVIYLTNGMVTGKKFIHYPVEEALKMYMRTINKFRGEKTSALICLREENHNIIKSERV